MSPVRAAVTFVLAMCLAMEAAAFYADAATNPLANDIEADDVGVLESLSVVVKVVDVSDTIVTQGEVLTFRATVAQGVAPVRAEVLWYVDGTRIACVADVDASGFASCAAVAALSAGLYTVTVVLRGADAKAMLVGTEHTILVVRGPGSWGLLQP